MKTGIELIAEERREQIEKHHITTEYDVVENSHGELRKGAIALMLMDGNGRLASMPSNWDREICSRMLDKPYKERLIIAASLLAAEIDRLNYINSQLPED